MSSSIETIMSKCSICKKIPEEVALQCELNHAICRRCARIIEEEQSETRLPTSECSICQQSVLNPETFTYVEPFRRFADIQQFVGAANTKICQASSHDQDQPADYHCSDCNIHLCEPCIEIHIPTARDAAKHRLFSIQETESKMSALKCSSCTDTASHFCPNGECQKAVCEPCVKRSHGDHNALTLQVAMKFLDESIDKHRAEMRRRSESLTSRARGIESLRSESYKEVDRVIARVRESASRMRAIIDRDEEELCQKIMAIKASSTAMFDAVFQDIEQNVNRFSLLEQLHSKLSDCEKSPLKTVSVFSFIMGNDLTGGAHRTDSVLSQLHSHQPYNWLYRPNSGYRALLEELHNRATNIFGEVSRRRTLEEVASLDVKSEHQAQVTGIDTSNEDQVAISDRYTGAISLYGVGGHINHIRDFRVSAVAVNASTEIQDIAFRPNGNLLVTNFPTSLVLEVTTSGTIVKHFRLNWPKTVWSPLGICINRRNEVAITFIGTCGVSSKKGFSIHVMDWDTSTVIRSRSLDFSPRYICPLEDGGYAVSDYISHSVYFLTPKLKPRFIYPGSAGLKSPSGICCLHNGNVLIAEKENCTVHEVSPSGNYRKVVLTERDGLRSPKVITYTKSGDIIIVDEGGDLIKAYRYHSMGRLKIS